MHSDPYRVTVLICARAGSRGLRHKNVRTLQGTPLLVRAIELALRSRRRGEQWRVLVSTDSPRYARLARRAGAEVPGLRPAHLARDDARLIDAALELLQRAGGESADAVLMLSATTPLTQPRDLREGLRAFRAGGGVSVAAVRRDPFAPSWRFRLVHDRLEARGRERRVTRRQDDPGVVLAGAFYFASPAWLARHRQFVRAGVTLGVPLPDRRCLDIETSDDLALAAWRLRPKKRA